MPRQIQADGKLSIQRLHGHKPAWIFQTPRRNHQMQHTDITADHASTLGVLVNTDRIRSSIKRLFHNRIDEVVSEIIQNCQRAGAKNVDIVTTENSFTIQDNGHGLLGGIDGFHTLLKLAESNFDNNTI